MSHPSKVKGSAFERECVDQALGCGLTAKRSWGSNGQSLGFHEEVDVLIETEKGQCKRRNRLGKLFTPSEHVDVQILRADHEKAFVVMTLTHYLELLRRIKDGRDQGGI